MITSGDCHGYAESFRTQAAEKAVAAARVHLLRSIAHSLSGLATQLDALREYEREAARAEERT
jgi:hypothetical protein